MNQSEMVLERSRVNSLYVAVECVRHLIFFKKKYQKCKKLCPYLKSAWNIQTEMRHLLYIEPCKCSYREEYESDIGK